MQIGGNEGLVCDKLMTTQEKSSFLHGSDQKLQVTELQKEKILSWERFSKPSLLP